MDSKRPRYPTRLERDRARKERAIGRLRATALGPAHPAVNFAVEHIAAQASIQTTTAYGCSLVRFFGFCARNGVEPLLVTTLEVRAFLAEETATGYVPATVGIRLATLGSYYAEALDRELVAKNPCRRIEKPDCSPVTDTPSLSFVQADLLAERCIAGILDPELAEARNGAMAYLMMRIGPRAGEVQDAQWGHVTRKLGGVAWKIHGKGNSWGEVTLPEDVVDIVECWRGRLELAIGRNVRVGDALFPRIGQGVHIRRAARLGPLESIGTGPISMIYKGLLGQIGVEGPRFAAHSARATAATLGYASTRDLLAVQRLLRHRSQVMSQRYIKNLAMPSPASAWVPAARLPAPIPDVA